jgi:hypothetical protein
MHDVLKKETFFFVISKVSEQGLSSLSKDFEMSEAKASCYPQIPLRRHN